MSECFILDGHTAVPADFETWARWFEKADQHVAQTDIAHVKVSTVFMGMNYALDPGPRQLFETMIFGGPKDGYQERCETWEQAEKMHACAVALAESAFEEH